jgi:hypothetical protein
MRRPSEVHIATAHAAKQRKPALTVLNGASGMKRGCF